VASDANQCCSIHLGDVEKAVFRFQSAMGVTRPVVNHKLAIVSLAMLADRIGITTIKTLTANTSTSATLTTA
jgi:hypothetical protein